MANLTRAQRIEFFHLAFLGVLSKRLDPSRHVLKGGANLRYFFGSVRYSEDIDLDLTRPPARKGRRGAACSRWRSARAPRPRASPRPGRRDHAVARMPRPVSSHRLQMAGDRGLHPLPRLGAVVELEHVGVEVGEDLVAIGVEREVEGALGGGGENLGIPEAGLVTPVRRGLWSVEVDPDPFAVAPYLTAPFPAYVSIFSAFAAHGMIEQIPGRVSVVSLDRARRIQTAIGAFDVHHIAPELFGGFAPWRRGGSMAGPEKALFDLVYLRAAAGGRAYLPELTLPDGFDPDALGAWLDRIGSPRLRTLVSRRLKELVDGSVTTG